MYLKYFILATHAFCLSLQFRADMSKTTKIIQTTDNNALEFYNKNNNYTAVINNTISSDFNEYDGITNEDLVNIIKDNESLWKFYNDKGDSGYIIILAFVICLVIYFTVIMCLMVTKYKK